MGDTKYATITLVVRRRWAGEVHPEDFIRPDTDDVMFAGSEPGVSPAALAAGAEPSSWPDAEPAAPSPHRIAYRDDGVAEDSCGSCLADLWSDGTGWIDDEGKAACPNGGTHRPNDDEEDGASPDLVCTCAQRVNPDTGEAGMTPDTVTCGHCGRSWCGRCHPTPSARCPFEYDHVYEED